MRWLAVRGDVVWLAAFAEVEAGPTAVRWSHQTTWMGKGSDVWTPVQEDLVLLTPPYARLRYPPRSVEVAQSDTAERTARVVAATLVTPLTLSADLIGVTAGWIPRAWGITGERRDPSEPSILGHILIGLSESGWLHWW